MNFESFEEVNEAIREQNKTIRDLKKQLREAENNKDKEELTEKLNVEQDILKSYLDIKNSFKGENQRNNFSSNNEKRNNQKKNNQKENNQQQNNQKKNNQKENNLNQEKKKEPVESSSEKTKRLLMDKIKADKIQKQIDEKELEKQELYAQMYTDSSPEVKKINEEIMALGKEKPSLTKSDSIMIKIYEIEQEVAVLRNEGYTDSSREIAELQEKIEKYNKEMADIKYKEEEPIRRAAEIKRLEEELKKVAEYRVKCKAEGNATEEIIASSEYNRIMQKIYELKNPEKKVNTVQTPGEKIKSTIEQKSEPKPEQESKKYPGTEPNPPAPENEPKIKSEEVTDSNVNINKPALIKESPLQKVGNFFIGVWRTFKDSRFANFFKRVFSNIGKGFVKGKDKFKNYENNEEIKNEKSKDRKFRFIKRNEKEEEIDEETKSYWLNDIELGESKGNMEERLNDNQSKNHVDIEELRKLQKEKREKNAAERIKIKKQNILDMKNSFDESLKVDYDGKAPDEDIPRTEGGRDKVDSE